MINNDTYLSQKISKILTCYFCNYNTSKRCDFIKYLNTTKHINNSYDTNDTSKVAKVAHNICSCGRQYKHSQKLSRHKKM